jgi:Fur family peroxide stress response transcriptional regulator
MEINQRLEELRVYCRENGIPLTQQRLVILRELAESNDHPSPEEIHIRLKRDFPTLSLATVYKNLEALSRIGFARKINPLSDHVRYDFDLHDHCHFICLSCKMIEDIDEPAIKTFEIPIPEHSDHKITSKAIQYYGICKLCRNDTET